MLVISLFHTGPSRASRSPEKSLVSALASLSRSSREASRAVAFHGGRARRADVIPGESDQGCRGRTALALRRQPAAGVTGPRHRWSGQGRPGRAGPKDRAVPLTRRRAPRYPAGRPRQRPVRGRVQGPGRGAAGEAVLAGEPSRCSRRA
jgi:hypothetical protein